MVCLLIHSAAAACTFLLTGKIGWLKIEIINYIIKALNLIGHIAVKVECR
jgi:hypothetical protein